MICRKCGRELRIVAEQSGVDNNNLPEYHRIAYCDTCMTKEDLDAKAANPPAGNEYTEITHTDATQTSTTYRKECPNCGNALTAGVNFCPKCGFKFAQSDTPTTPPIPPQNTPYNGELVTKTYRKKKKSNVPLLLFLLILVGGGAYFTMYRGYTPQQLLDNAKVGIDQVINRNKPETAVRKFCNGLKNTDYETMSSVMLKNVEDSTSDEVKSLEENSALFEYITELDKEINYEVLDSKVEGDSATVKVSIDYKNARLVFTETLSEYFQKSLELAFSGTTPSDEEMSQILTDIFNKKRENIKAEDDNKTVEFKCSKVDGQWMINEAPYEVLDVMTGGLLSVADSIGNGMSDTSSESLAEEKQSYNVHQVKPGEEIELATLKLTVLGCEETDTIKGQFSTSQAKEGTKYVVFTVKAENIKKEEFAFPDLTLMDDQDRVYQVDSDSMFSADDNIVYRSLAPNIPETGVAVYNVPTDCTGYRLVTIKDGTDDWYDFYGN